jgi:hypothetical protein
MATRTVTGQHRGSLAGARRNCRRLSRSWTTTTCEDPWRVFQIGKVDSVTVRLENGDQLLDLSQVQYVHTLTAELLVTAGLIVTYSAIQGNAMARSVVQNKIFQLGLKTPIRHRACGVPRVLGIPRD